jgi:hypothetical protein
VSGPGDEAIPRQGRRWLLVAADITEAAVNSMVRGILAAVALLLFATTAVAQTKDSPAPAVSELQHAATLMNSAHEFFRQEALGRQPASSERDIAQHLQKMAEATATFLQLAPKPMANDALGFVQFLFKGRQHSIPSTLMQAIEELKKSRDFRLLSNIAGSLSGRLNSAREDIESEIAFGPIIDNPQLYGGIIPPTTGGELLRNLRFALDHDVVLRRDFYTPENLKRFFGASATIYRTSNGGIWAVWAVRPTAPKLARLKPTVRRYAQCQYSARLHSADPEKKKGWISVSCNYEHAGSPTLEEVERVFGKEWQDTWIPSPHGLPKSSAAPYPVRMTYNVDKGALRRSIEVDFGPDETFNSFHLAEEER